MRSVAGAPISREVPLFDPVQMDDSEGEDAASAADTLAERQRLKAALHHAVGKVCGEVEGSEFSREVVAAVTEAAFNQTQLLAADVEAFAKSVGSQPVVISRK